MTRVGRVPGTRSRNGSSSRRFTTNWILALSSTRQVINTSTDEHYEGKPTSHRAGQSVGSSSRDFGNGAFIVFVDFELVPEYSTFTLTFNSF